MITLSGVLWSKVSYPFKITWHRIFLKIPICIATYSCYNTAWLLTDITDQAGEISAEKVLAIEVQIDRCLKQPAATAAKNVKCHLSQQVASLFIAETVLEQ